MKLELCSSEKKGLFSFFRAPLSSALFWREMRSGGWSYVLLAFSVLLVVAFCFMYWSVNRDVIKRWPYVENGVWHVVIPSLLFFLPSFTLLGKRMETSRSMLELLKLASSSGMHLGSCLWGVGCMRVLSLAASALPFVILQIHVSGGSMLAGGCFYIFLIFLSLCLTSFSLWLAPFSALFKMLYIGFLILMTSLADDFIFTQIPHYNDGIKSWVEMLFADRDVPRLCFSFFLGSCFFFFTALAILSLYCRRFISPHENVSGSLRRVLSCFIFFPLMCFFFLLWKNPEDGVMAERIMLFSFTAIFIFSLFDMAGDDRGAVGGGSAPEKVRYEWMSMLFKPGWPSAGLYLLISSVIFSFIVWGMKIYLFPVLGVISNDRIPVVFVLLSANYLLVFYVLRKWLVRTSALFSLMIVSCAFIISFSATWWKIVEQHAYMKVISGGMPLVNFVRYWESPERLWGNLFFIIFVVLLYIRKSCSHCCKRPN